ncbi:DNA polymerase III subunit gamma/tau [Methylotenera sp.]|uniref:DNA polymerase III subunit gamma/tau n=1 Tax=Methylotenera sp. TaxID=2051956 RepID=UPI00272124F6|nr:DNA polymerase III subunit gamma/tau [Methylotenera sp.]MDO9204325.1 DNA polymerase III subunit gamma/tau [Methylotenera sp.]MDO9393753.1 DNA polymerase III subunit gamma/tau [Methylotenera sp.]MDP1522518.1 DNA polymerase III subunit gamma/tau [Methylotenera sp.]MDP3005329.1 DNA polymerase III subunit gamma/tau [Methylotenera sp.]MDP3308149.1 DNA polymerase III subunit gamma/tau [Methylotenera sp.]
MSYQVLARKWRPKSFETLVGQDHVVRALTNALEQNRLHHAYLFTGTRGVGKTTVARILAKSLNCETGITAKPCGVCDACTEIDRGRFVDLIEVDAASNTQVDAMRDLLDNAQYAPTAGRFKVYIIDEVHMLSKSAFNAMLKTLEEPPAHVKFILATTDPQKVPVTVLSRCLQFNLRQMAGTSIISHLQNILGQENIPYEPTALHLISRAAAGSMRDALSLTDQAIAYGGQTVNESEVRAMLGAIDQSYLYQLIDALLANDGAGIIAQAKSMEERSLSFEAALNDLAQLLHQIAVAQTVPDSVADDLPERTLLLGLAQRISPETLQLYYQIALLGRRDIGLAPDEFAGFTMSLLRMLAFTPSEGEAKKLPNKPLAQPNKAQADTLVKPQILSQPIEKSIDKPIDKPAEPVLQQSDTLQADEMIENESNQSFNGNWRGLLDQLKLGLARNLALNSALLSYDENTMRFAIQDKDKALLSPMYQDKLSSALQQHFGRKIRLEFSVEGSVNTPAKQVAQEKAHAQANAESSIEDDSFVQALINDFGASIIPNSIKPI